MLVLILLVKLKNPLHFSTPFEWGTLGSERDYDSESPVKYCSETNLGNLDFI